MEKLMKKRQKLVAETDLPPISFGLSKQQVDDNSDMTLNNHATFFKSFYDNGITLAKPDLEKKLIVQRNKLQDEDEQGYRRAHYLKEHQVTQKMI